MAYESPRNRYVSDGAGVVPQPRLLVMLYDRMVADLEQAEAALETKDYELVNAKLTHTQDIILELQSALQVDAWDGAAQLASLYEWFNDELVKANVQKSAKPLRSVLKMIRELADAWHQAYDQMLNTPTAPATATAAPQFS